MGSGPVPSVKPSKAPVIDSSARTPTKRPTKSVEPSATTTVPEPSPGRRLDSPGGVAYATCADGRATLTDAEPYDGFYADVLQPGPALTARILFTGARSQYRMAVTCVGDSPTAVVLPL